MDSEEQLRKALKDFTRPSFYTIAAKVLEVDDSKLHIDVKPADGGAEIFNVRLRAAIDGQNTGVVVIPKVGSQVLITSINNNWNSAFVSATTEVDKVLAKVGNMSYQLDSSGFVINEGQFGGLVKIETLVDRINRLEERMASHQHICASQGSPTAPDPATNSPLSQTQRAELENTKVKH